MMPVKRKKERQSKKELKIREEERELENMTVEKRFSAKLLYILFSWSFTSKAIIGLKILYEQFSP